MTASPLFICAYYMLMKHKSNEVPHSTSPLRFHLNGRNLKQFSRWMSKNWTEISILFAQPKHVSNIWLLKLQSYTNNNNNKIWTQKFDYVILLYGAAIGFIPIWHIQSLFRYKYIYCEFLHMYADTAHTSKLKSHIDKLHSMFAATSMDRSAQ